MLNDSDAVEAADLQRRRVLSAFTTGSAADPVALSRRPNRGIWAGVALTVLGCLGTAIGTLLSDDVPKDWADRGNVVVRASTGLRYVSTGDRLRPLLNDTSLALAGLRQPREIRVDDTRFRTLPVGAPFGIPGAPGRRPQVPDDDVAWWACQQPGQPLAVLTRSDPGGRGRALLAQDERGGTLSLVVDGVARPLPAEAASALGYDPAAARVLPDAFLGLLPVGGPLALLPRPAPPPAAPPPPAPPAGPVDPAAPPVPPPPPPPGPPSFLAAGTLVQDASNDALFVADAGQLRPVTSESALRLLYGGRPPAPVRVAADELGDVPDGPPVEVPDFPAEPPPAVAGTSVVCVSTAGGVVAEESALPVLGLRAGPPPGAGRATVWQPEGVGALVRSDATARAAVTEQDPLLLVADGLAHPLPDEATLAALGYGGDQVRARPPAWLALVDRGPGLRPLRLDDPGAPAPG